MNLRAEEYWRKAKPTLSWTSGWIGNDEQQQYSFLPLHKHTPFILHSSKLSKLFLGPTFASRSSFACLDQALGLKFYFVHALL